MKQARVRSCAAMLLAFGVGAAASSPQAQPPPAAMRWFRGNTHAHTLNSDGDSAPDVVARWYREQGYQFLVLTDHNFVTPVEGLNALIGAPGKFLLIEGEEITDRSGDKPVHVNALGLRELVAPQGGPSPGDVLARDVAAVRAAGAVAQVNHPNFGWALSSADIVRGGAAELLEIFNGHPQVNNDGGGDAAGAEALWDVLLSSGHRVYGVASDDTHDLRRLGVQQAAGPGRGWVVVRAARLTAVDILAALSRGDFYASTGIELLDVRPEPRRLAVSIKERGTTRYRTRFIGQGGRVLAERDGPEASYAVTGGEGYVRALVTDSNGLRAWTQPVRVAADVGGWR